MKFDNLIDMHTHSDNSFDGNQCCMLLCEKAAEKGASCIAITDHCEIDSKTEDFRALCINQYVETFECKRFFEGKLLVLQGIELGQAIYNKKLAESILDKFNYDFVLGAIHNLPDTEDFCFLNYDEHDIYDLLQKYFEQILKLTQWNGFDSLAHLTYPLRYICECQKEVDMNRFDDIIDSILICLATNGKALEINTSGLFRGLNDTLPNIKYVKRFKELGGEYVTVGSDAHHSDKLFAGVKKGMKIAKDSGFDCVTIFSKREPILIPIK